VIVILANARISTIHGQAKKHGGRMIVPMYHPAAALHQPSLRATIEEDFAKLPGLIDGFEGDVVPQQQQQDPQQLSLF
jgi:DNA polymerase